MEFAKPMVPALKSEKSEAEPAPVADFSYRTQPPIRRQFVIFSMLLISPAVLTLVVSAATVEGAIARGLLVFGAIAAAALAFFGALLAERQFMKPFRALAVASSMLQRRSSQPLSDDLLLRNDEVGAIARSVDSMAKQLTRWDLKFRELVQAEVKGADVAERMAHDLNTARNIQLGIVTRRLSRDPERRFDVAAYLEPAKEVGGDLYLVEMLDDKHLCFVVGDVSDKGIPAALFMAVTITLARAKLRYIKDPALVLARLNDDLSLDNPQTMFVTMACGVLNVDTGVLEMASAGHTLPVLIRKGEASWLYDDCGTAAGIQPGLVFTKHSFQLQQGDQLVLYTDGVTEAMNASSDLFGDDRLLSTVGIESNSLSPRDTLNRVRSAVKTFAGDAPPSDDIAVVVLGYRTWGA